MNYRHAYHAGNFADVVKHAVLTLVILRLKAKDAAFRIVDTHAGLGIYDLTGAEAAKTGEWQCGIGRLLGPDARGTDARTYGDDLGRLLGPYLDIVTALNPTGALERYPGSPQIARALMRPQDRMILNELHPQDAASLRQAFARDKQAKVLELDAYTALKAVLPPKERRGLVLIDPPFEKRDEFERLLRGLGDALRRFATGVYVIWYPTKDAAAVSAFRDALDAFGGIRLLVAELDLNGAQGDGRLGGCGVAVINPPYRLDEDISLLMEGLGQVLGGAGGATVRVDAVASQGLKNT